MATTEIRDSRAKDWFYLDNELLEVFGGKGKEDQGIGIHAIGVYMVLAKHANNDTQKCKPSYQTIATILGVSRNTVITAIKTLDKAGLISIEQRISHEKNKPTTTNIYTLLKIKKAATPIPTDEPASASPAPPSARDGIGVVQEVVHPIPPEVPELDLSDNTNLNKTISSSAREKPAMPFKSNTQEPTENKKIAAYFAKSINSHEDTLSAMDYRDINRLVDEGFTLERARPGIDETVSGIRSRPNGVVRSFRVCEKSIRQLDPTNQPVFIQDYLPRPPQPDPNAESNARWMEKKYAKMIAQGQIPVTA